MAHILYDTLYDLKVPCPRSNSGKRTLAYTATKLFNDLSSDLKEFSISSSPLIFKFLPSSLKSKLRSLFFSRLSSAEHLEARLVAFLFIVTVFHSPTTTTITSFNLYLCIYVYMFIYSTYFAPLRRFIYYSLRAYSLFYFKYCLFCVYIYL